MSDLEESIELERKLRQLRVAAADAAAYAEKYGEDSWEVDALDPPTLSQIIRDAFENIIDRDAMDRVIAQEEADKQKLRALVAKGKFSEL